MDCKLTSTRTVRRHAAGYSIIETYFAIGIFSLVMAALASFMLYTGTGFAGMFNYVDLEQRSQNALDRLTKDVRQVQGVTAIATNRLLFSDFDGVALDYTFDPAKGTLTRTKGNETPQVLLTGCDFLCFSNMQRNPVAGEFDQYPVTISPTNTKLVSVTWVCSRKILDAKINTESVQTAKIVIRKQ